MKKILFVFGTRPEAIKTIPVVNEFKKNNRDFKVKVCITAQHREMLDSVMEFFTIEADYDLNIMKNNQSLNELTANILRGVEQVLDEVKPDIVFVHGDTTTTFATTLASYYKQVDVAHLEAGLRTNNIYSPFPEEINRQLVSRMAKFHFAPTEKAVDTLISELVKKESIYLVGNSVVDSLNLTINKINSEEKLKATIIQNLKDVGFEIDKKRKIVLITGHRRENFGEGFLQICSAIQKLSNKYSEIDFVYPVHLNPNVKKPVNELLKGIKNVHLINPLNYQEFVYIMNNSHLILTDSGGIQEEAPTFGIPILVMRNNTERPEAISSGVAKLVGTDRIFENADLLLSNEQEYKNMSKATNPFGDGKTSKKIVEVIKSVQ